MKPFHALFGFYVLITVSLIPRVTSESCTFDSDCSDCGADCRGGKCYGGHYCGYGQVCSNGFNERCVDCNWDSDCRYGHGHKTTCDTSTRTCVECRFDSDCSNGQHCDTYRHECVECTRDSHCTRGTECGNTCSSSHQCRGTNVFCTGSTNVCIPNQIRCVEFIQDSDCSSGKYCQASNNQCVDCLTDSHCRSDSNCNGYCSGNTCHSKYLNQTLNCVTNSDGLNRCAVNSAICVACDNDSHCSGETPFCSPQKKCVMYIE